MLLWHNDFRAIFWVAAIPAALAIALLFFGLKEPAAVITDKRTHPITRANLRLLGRGYWWWASAPSSRWRASARRFWC